MHYFVGEGYGGSWAAVKVFYGFNDVLPLSIRYWASASLNKGCPFSTAAFSSGVISMEEVDFAGRDHLGNFGVGDPERLGVGHDHGLPFFGGVAGDPGGGLHGHYQRFWLSHIWQLGELVAPCGHGHISEIAQGSFFFLWCRISAVCIIHKFAEKAGFDRGWLVTLS